MTKLTGASPRLDGKAFRHAMGRLPTSVVVVSATSDDRPVGMVIGTFTSVSLEPILVGFFADRSSGTLPRLLGSPFWTFSVLRQDDATTVPRFLRPPDERFEGVEWESGPYGAPELVDACLTVRTRNAGSCDAGDHVLLLGEVLEIEGGGPMQRPLVFFGGRMTRLDPGRLVDSELWSLGFGE